MTVHCPSRLLLNLYDSHVNFRTILTWAASVLKFSEQQGLEFFSTCTLGFFSLFLITPVSVNRKVKAWDTSHICSTSHFPQILDSILLFSFVACSQSYILFHYFSVMYIPQCAFKPYMHLTHACFTYYHDSCYIYVPHVSNKL